VNAGEIITKRQLSHGNFSDTAKHAQTLKEALHSMPNWETLSATQREALEMIAVKLVRIGCGDPSARDHWNDIAGYAALWHCECR